MGVADRTLKSFDYISNGLLPLDDAGTTSGAAREEPALAPSHRSFEKNKYRAIVHTHLDIMWRYSKCE